MRLNQESLNLIKNWEGCKLSAYIDIAGKLTIGTGHLVKPGEPYKLGQTISQEEADDLLQKDLESVEAQIEKYVKVPLNENQFGALTSLVFNVGSFCISTGTIGHYLNLGDYKEAVNNFLIWCRYKNKDGQLVISSGLLNRRKSEVQLWNKPVERELTEEEIEQINNNIKISLNSIISDDFWHNNEE